LAFLAAAALRTKADWGLISLSGMVEIPRPFDGAQGMLQAKQDSARCERSEH